MITDNHLNIHSTMLDNSTSLIDLFEGSGLDAADDTNEPTLFQNSPYYDNVQFKDFISDHHNKFTVLSLNCQSLHAKYDCLKTYLEMYNSSSSKICAVSLQETWLSADSDVSPFQLDGYNFIHKGKSCSAHGGVAIYLHESLQYEILDIYDNSEIWDGLFIKISVENGNIGHKTLVLGSIYRPPRPTTANISTFIDELNEVANRLKNYKDVVISGDFNLDLLKFRENNNINDFLDFMISCSYFPTITLPTRLTNRQGTLIDNFFVKTDKHLFDTQSGIILSQISDHLPYFMALDYVQMSKPSVKHIKLVASDSRSYMDFRNELQSEYISQKLHASYSTNPNSSYNNLHEILQYLMDKHFPAKLVKRNKYKHKNSPWITQGILKSIRYKDKLYVKLKSTPTNNENFEQRQINFKTYSKILKHTINFAKKNHYQNCFEKFKCDLKKTWSTINGILNRNKKKKDFPKHFEIHGQSVSNEKLIANEFNKYFINVGPSLAENTTCPSNICFKDYLTAPEKNRFEFKTVTVESVIDIINTLKPKTSCNLDRISSKLLKYIKNEIAPTLTDVINQSITQGIFPDLLKKAKIIPLYKNNEDYLFCNYRPISILSSVSKVFEKIMFNQMFEYFSQLNIFYNGQYGFRKFHSTELATLELVDRITYAMDQNLLPINIYLDLSKAFDTLDHQILLHKLQYYGISGTSLELIKCYLNNRTQQLQYNDIISDPLSIKCGVPQGSILGPLMFIVYINDITFASNFFQPILYADDTTLCATLHNNYNTADTEQLNNELSAISNWLKANKLSLNVSKTKAILFHTPQRRVHHPELYLDGVKIDFVDNFNFLGIILNKNLKWKNHIDMISKKISKTVGIMKKLKHFLPAGALMNIYNALILSYLNYGIIVWGSQCDRLFKLQKKAVRIITKSKYNAHISPLFKRLHILKLHDLCALHDLKFCYKFGNDLLPSYFSSKLFCRFSSSHIRLTRNRYNLPLPAVSHDFARCTISYKFPKTFNNMDASIKEKIDTHSFSGFKTYVKEKMLHNYSTTCNIHHCYICRNN